MPSSSFIERSVDIAAPLEDVFAFHLDTRNAALISPSSTRILSVEGEFPVVEGALVKMRMRQRPMPFGMTWRVRIDDVTEPHRIVDVAERSPFAEWRHEHLFAEAGGGRTRMTDRVTYRLPAGPIGRLIDRLVVGRQLGSAFEERHRRTRALLEERARDASPG
jgi:ligand-binding SRPBCC domain-containing protein